MVSICTARFNTKNCLIHVALGDGNYLTWCTTHERKPFKSAVVGTCTTRFNTRNNIFCPDSALYDCHTQPVYSTQHSLSNGGMHVFSLRYKMHLYVKCRSILVFKGWNKTLFVVLLKHCLDQGHPTCSLPEIFGNIFNLIHELVG